ncbi:hypothetical protein [Sphaerochaeta pleomorpha]|uniref:hypothetical protein n=1 Tax=Sphaerochaeta pleomorpha TaxID=1131707 RepID=UPI0009D9F37E
MDLFLASHNLGSLWYALAKPDQMQVGGLAYVIMLAFGKSQEQDFRKNLSDFKRKQQHHCLSQHKCQILHSSEQTTLLQFHR